MQVEHQGRRWQKDDQGVITFWDGTQWVWWDPNTPGPQPPPWFTSGNPPRKSSRKWPFIVGGVLVLIVIAALAAPEETPPSNGGGNSPSGEDEDPCQEVIPSRVRDMSAQRRNGVKSWTLMTFERIEREDVPLFVRIPPQKDAWFIAADVEGIGPAVWVTGLDPQDASDSVGLVVGVNDEAREASSLGVDVPRNLLPTEDHPALERVAECAQESG